MELLDLLARRRMTRSFSGDAIDHQRLDELCVESLRAPTAGNSAGVRMCTVPREQLPGYFAAATDPEWRERSARWPGLSRAAAAVVITSRPGDYLARYGEADKSASGLDEPDAWRVPYWHTDAAMAAMALLLLLEEAGLGAALWGNFRHEERVLDFIGAKDEALFATVLVGVADGRDRPSASLARPTPTRRERVRRLGAAAAEG